MGLLDFLRSDPTDEWPPAKTFDLSLDLRNNTMNAIAIGDKVAVLERFGRPTNRLPSREGFFNYEFSGAEFGATDGLIDYFAMAIIDDPTVPLRAASAKMTGRDGRVLKLSSRTTIADVKSLIGVEPFSDVDEEEIVETYDLGDYTLEVEATPAGHLKRVNYFLD